MEHDGASCSLRLLVDKNDHYHSFSLDHLGDFDYIVIFCVREIFPFFNFIRAENFYFKNCFFGYYANVFKWYFPSPETNISSTLRVSTVCYFNRRVGFLICVIIRIYFYSIPLDIDFASSYANLNDLR